MAKKQTEKPVKLKDKLSAQADLLKDLTLEQLQDELTGVQQSIAESKLYERAVLMAIDKLTAEEDAARHPHQVQIDIMAAIDDSNRSRAERHAAAQAQADLLPDGIVRQKAPIDAALAGGRQRGGQRPNIPLH